MAPSPLLRLFILTFNCALNAIDPVEFADHLYDNLREQQQQLIDGPPELPHLVVFSLQEFAPFSHAFRGGSYLAPYFSRFRTAFDSAIARLAQDASAALLMESSTSSSAAPHHGAVENYRLVCAKNVGTTALMILAQDAHNAPSQMAMCDLLQEAECSFGVLGFASKGAVGVRLRWKQDGGEGGAEGSSADAGAGASAHSALCTFIAAHLTASEHQAARRNADWHYITTNLVFDRPRVVAAGTAPRACGDGAGPGTVFVAGDLNYRSRDERPSTTESATYTSLEPDADEQDWAWLLEGDQLSREMRERRTLDGFHEVGVHFGPTYKYLVHVDTDGTGLGRVGGAQGEHDGGEDLFLIHKHNHHGTLKDHGDENQNSGERLSSSFSSSSLTGRLHWRWAPSRWPSWCDRILFRAFDDAHDGRQSHAHTTRSSSPSHLRRRRSTGKQKAHLDDNTVTTDISPLVSPPAHHTQSYTSLPILSTSDHRPVVLHTSLPLIPSPPLQRPCLSHAGLASQTDGDVSSRRESRPYDRDDDDAGGLPVGPLSTAGPDVDPWARQKRWLRRQVEYVLGWAMLVGEMLWAPGQQRGKGAWVAGTVFVVFIVVMGTAWREEVGSGVVG